MSHIVACTHNDETVTDEIVHQVSEKYPDWVLQLHLRCDMNARKKAVLVCYVLFKKILPQWASPIVSLSDFLPC